MQLKTCYEKVIDGYREQFVLYLYSNTKQNIPPIAHKIKTKEECKTKKHNFKLTEERYGNAIFIFKICISCGHGYAECCPPLQIRKQGAVEIG